MTGEWDRSRELVHAALTARDLAMLVSTTSARSRIALTDLSPDAQAQLLIARTAEVGPSSDALVSLLDSARGSDRGLVAKFTVEAFDDRFHLGNAVPLFLLRRLALMGHRVVMVVGDATTGLGDQSGSVASTVAPSADEQARNLTAYRRQVAPILEGVVSRWVHNSSWIDEVRLARLAAMARAVPVESLDLPGDATLAQALYPLAKTLDTIETGADLEVGGRYQVRNMEITRRVAAAEGWSAPVALATPLILGCDGDELMSARRGNHVPLDASPQQVLTALADVPEPLLLDYLRAFTDWLDDEIERAVEVLGPHGVRRALAVDIVATLHGLDAALVMTSDKTPRSREGREP